MEIDAEAMMTQAKSQYGELAGANMVLAGQVGALRKQIENLEAELEELKKLKE